MIQQSHSCAHIWRKTWLKGYMDRSVHCTAGISIYDGDLRLPLGLALRSPIFASSCEGIKTLLTVLCDNLEG